MRKITNTVISKTEPQTDCIMSIYPVFFCRFAAGYGTATFNSNDGGKAYIITANGHGVQYNISKDGAITRITDNELNS